MNALPTLSVKPDTREPEENPRVTQALEEYLLALESGTRLDRRQLKERYPDVADAVDRCLQGLDFLHHSAGSLQVRDDVPEQLPALEEYRIVREIGRGGMGIVYEAVQRSLSRRVALKVLTIGAALDPRHLQRFKNEALAAAQLQHEHIVPVHAVGFEQGIHFYAMRFIDGLTLAQIIDAKRGGVAADQKGKETAEAGDKLTGSQLATGGQPDEASSRSPSPLPGSPRIGSTVDSEEFRKAAQLGIQAAEALEHAHQMGIVHRDVKPANLLVDRNDHLWITDFGLARWQADAALTTTGDVLGTLRYMSPEQASARRGLVDHRSDIYSLGATLYELATLQPVLQGGDQRELLHQLLHEEPIAPRRVRHSVPRDLETILLKALAKSVEERYATAQEMAEDLKRFLDGRPVLARRPGLWDRMGKWARRHRAWAAAAAALLVLAVLGLCVGGVLLGREQAKTREAYEQEAAARKTEAEERAKAEHNFRQARQLVDYIAEIAATDLAAETDVLNVRRKLLESALTYYQNFLDQQGENQLTRDELLRGYTRVANLLGAIGRQKDAQVAWSRAQGIALTFGDAKGSFKVIPVRSSMRLLRLASVQADMELTPQQVQAIQELEANERREEIGGRPVKSQVSPNPGNMVNYRGQNGEAFLFEVTGAQEGTVWGTDIYTDDSSIAMAAVHMGILRVGQKGIVKVTVLQGEPAYTSSERNGVTTNPWQQWGGSYKLEAVESLEQKALAQLQPAQGKRLKQLLLQQAGLWAFEDATVRAELHLNDQQREAIAAIQRETRPMAGGAGEPGRLAPIDRILKHLTDDQKAGWQELVGEPFKGTLPPRELILDMGRMTIQLVPSKPTPPQK